MASLWSCIAIIDSDGKHPVLLLAIFSGRTPEMDLPDSSRAWLWFLEEIPFLLLYMEFKKRCVNYA